MNKIYLLIFISLLSFDFTKAEIQLYNPNVKFEVRTSKVEVLKCECFILTAALLVDNKNTMSLKHHDLMNQVIALRKALIPENVWHHDLEITEITETKFRNGQFENVEFKIIESAICPMDSGPFVIPSLSFKLMDTKQGKIFTLFSNEKKVMVNDLPQAVTDSIYKNDYYQMIGDMQLHEYYDRSLVSFKVGDTINYSLRLLGNGISFPIELDLPSQNDIDILILNKEVKDTLRYGKIRLIKNFSLQLIPKRPGIFNLSSFFGWSFYSLKERKVKKLVPRAFFAVEGTLFQIDSAKVENVNPDVVIALDVSESMEIEDYFPNRLHVGLEIVKRLSPLNCNIPFLIFTSQIKEVNICNIDPSIKYQLKKGGTAIGNAIWSAIQILKFSDSNDKKIIIICDGDNTSGKISELAAAKLANSYGIRIISVGIGSIDKTPFGLDEFGAVQYVINTYSESSLRSISKLSNGKFIHVEKSYNLSELVTQIFN